MADCFIRDDCSIRVYRSVSYTRVQKSDQAIAGAGEYFFGRGFNFEIFLNSIFLWIIRKLFFT